MRTMMIVLAAVLLAAPLAAQAGEQATDAWMRMPAPDPRLRVEFATEPVSGTDEAAWRSRMPLPYWMLLGATAGCLGGSVVMARGEEPRDKPEARFNGCILGGAAGMFLGGVYGLLTGG